MSERAAWRRISETTIDNNWGMILLMGLLFAFCTFLFAWAIRDFVFGNVDHGRPRNLDAIGYAIVAIYGFVFTYSFRVKSVKVAFFLMAINCARLAVGYFYPQAIHQPSIAVIGSITKQIALAIFIFAIAQWFKLVICRPTAVDARGRN